MKSKCCSTKFRSNTSSTCSSTTTKASSIFPFCVGTTTSRSSERRYTRRSRRCRVGATLSTNWCWSSRARQLTRPTAAAAASCASTTRRWPTASHSSRQIPRTRTPRSPTRPTHRKSQSYQNRRTRSRTRVAAKTLSSRRFPKRLPMNTRRNTRAFRLRKTLQNNITAAAKAKKIFLTRVKWARSI